MPRTPRYRNKNGYGHCRIKGRDYYFGRWQKSPPKEYFSLIARHLEAATSPRVELALPAVPTGGPAVELTVTELIERYIDSHVDVHYRHPQRSQFDPPSTATDVRAVR